MGRRGDRRVVVRGFRLVSAWRARASRLAYRLAGQGRLTAALTTVVRALASGMLLLVIVAGLFGNQDPIRNIAPVMIWIIGWVGLALLSVLLGDVWRLVNHWNWVFSLAEVCCVILWVVVLLV